MAPVQGKVNGGNPLKFHVTMDHRLLMKIIPIRRYLSEWRNRALLEPLFIPPRGRLILNSTGLSGLWHGYDPPLTGFLQPSRRILFYIGIGNGHSFDPVSLVRVQDIVRKGTIRRCEDYGKCMLWL